jgi:hypothetical protein
VDLLADREAESVKRWLAAHPEVDVVSRDRGAVYIDGANGSSTLPLLAPFAIEMALSLPNPEGRTCRHSEKGSRYLPR